MAVAVHPETRQPNRSRLSDQVYDRLLAEILSGARPAGGVVSELRIAEEFDVSRTPVHDAIRQLIGDGLVEQRVNHRAVVAKFDASDVAEVFEMRKLLEGEAAARAASRIARIELEQLRQSSEQWRSRRNRRTAIADWDEIDDEFHTTIAEACGSSRLRDDVLRYRRLHRGINAFNESVDGLDQAVAEHVRIMDALADRDADEARRAMVAHVHEWQAYFVRRFDR